MYPKFYKFYIGDFYWWIEFAISDFNASGPFHLWLHMPMHLKINRAGIGAQMMDYGTSGTVVPSIVVMAPNWSLGLRVGQCILNLQSPFRGLFPLKDDQAIGEPKTL